MIRLTPFPDRIYPSNPIYAGFTPEKEPYVWVNPHHITYMTRTQRQHTDGSKSLEPVNTIIDCTWISFPAGLAEESDSICVLEHPDVIFDLIKRDV